ncbi:MAG: acylneuraminate cytidylyltransferase [Planctomycetes bacterium]|nr:acylneuraminate cytidylyltransferase [Planctomycetota bacterium]
MVAVIPARGGSKGLPRKNVLPLGGRPLIAHTIAAARAAARVGRVFVSTDDVEIAGVARRCGAGVVDRPAALAGDAAASESTLLHALETIEREEGCRPSLLVFLQCTSPLTAPADIDGTIAALIDEDADTAVSVVPFHYFLWQRDADGWGVGINHDKAVRPLRQDRRLQYVETGAVYVMKVEGFLKARHRFFGRTALYVTPGDRHWEIDEPVDLTVAAALMAERDRRAALDLLPSPPRAVVMDFDGVFTDNRVLVDQEGVESVWCHRGDGMGLSHLKARGLPMAVITTEANPVGAVRCAKLGLPCLHGVRDKLPVLLEWLAGQGVDAADTVYVGNDVNDLACLQAVGCPVVVADAHPAVRALGRLVLASPGGHGAVRELCDLVEAKLDSGVSA